MIKKNETNLIKLLDDYFANITLATFLEKEDENFTRFYQMRPQLINDHKLTTNNYKLPKGFSYILHKRFYYYLSEKVLGTQELESMDKLALWDSALDEILDFIKLENVSDEVKNEIREIYTQSMYKQHLEIYDSLSRKITSTQEEYFSNIIFASNKLSKLKHNKFSDIYTMNFRDEIFRQIFPKKSSYENFFHDYISTKYGHQHLEMIATTVFFHIHNKFLPSTKTQNDLFLETMNLQRKLSASDLSELENLEHIFVKNRSNIRIYNSKFKEHFDGMKNEYEVNI
ncbi:MAG: hypothetical protein ACOC1K_01970 [Nanoarchaeota archaeon]